MKNFDEYEKIKLDYPESFPLLPSKVDLKMASEFQSNFCGNFDTLESDEADLLSLLYVFHDLNELANKSSTKSLMGEYLDIILDSKFKDVVFNDIACSFYFLSRAKLSEQHRNQAIKFLKKVGQSFAKETKLQEPTENSQSHTEDKIFGSLPHSEFPKVENEISRFEDLASNLRKRIFWREYKTHFPILFDIYKYLLPIPSSNSSVERCFSISKHIFNDLKSQSSMESIESQMYLKFEMKDIIF